MIQSRALNRLRHVLLIAVLSAGLRAGATDFGIFVDGGYGPGETDMNGLVSGRVDGARMVFDRRHPDGQSTRATSKAELEAQIKAIECGAGDSITLVMVGHGRAGGKSSEELFYFALSPDGPAQHVSADELKEWLGAATIGCECEIHIVIFSCHSGAFINDLFMDQHVKSVFTSCQSDELTYTDAFTDARGFQDRGDWMSGFIDGWAGAAADADEGAALEEAAEQAWAAIPINYGEVQKPAGWRRGELPVKAHVERQSGRDPKSVKVRFWTPSWLRCYEYSIPVGPGVVFPNSFQECEWIEFNATFGAPAEDGVPNRNNSQMTGNPTACPPPTETVIAHVEGGDRGRGEIAIHTFAPNWEACQRRTLKTGEGVMIDQELRRSSWIQQPVTVNDPDGELTTGVAVAPAAPKVAVVAHVDNPQAGPNTIGVTIRRPAFLARLLGPIKIRLRGRQTQLLPQLARCDLIRVELCLRQVADQTYEVTEIAEIDQTRGFSFQIDAGLDRITRPARIHPLSQPVEPRCVLRNAGEQPLEQIRILGRIFLSGTTVYSNLQVVPFLAADSRIEVAFPGWMAETGKYRVEFEIQTGADENLLNNNLAMGFAVDVLEPAAPAWESTHLDSGQPSPFTAVENDLSLTGFGPGFRSNLSDSAAWLYQPINRDFEITAFLGPQTEGVHAGFMAREANDVTAPFVALVIEPGLGAKLLVRTESGEEIREIAVKPGVTFPLWIRLVRQGDLLAGQYSLDGESWVDVGLAELPALPEAILVGPVSYSGGPNVLTAVFQDVSGFPTATAIIPRPADVRAQAVATNQVALAWQDRSLTELGFQVERAEAAGGFVSVAQLPPNTQTYTDTGLRPATLYTYRLRALQPVANQDWSEVASAVTFGNGLATWAQAFGVDDPYRGSLTSEAPVVAYFRGALPTTSSSGVSIVSEGPNVFLQLAKGAGIYDVQAEIEELDDRWQVWSPLYTLGREFPSGAHKFLLPQDDDGVGIVRVKFSPAP